MSESIDKITRTQRNRDPYAGCRRVDPYETRRSWPWRSGAILFAALVIGAWVWGLK